MTITDIATGDIAATEDALMLDAAAADLLFRTARTANTFSDDPVSDEQVHAIYDLIKWAPTSMNTQPLRIILVRSPEARERLVRHLSPGNQAKTRSAPLVAIVAADVDFHENLPQVFPHLPNARDFFTEPVAREQTARFNAGLQIGYFILGIRAAGLAAGPMTGLDATAIDKEFFADQPLRTLAVINIGKPGENPWFDRSPRLDYEQVVSVL
ncbi:malonic semialdehyde reductase [Frankia sp. CiP3]|uniref:malonic semialdehyde reductase n=1 Tax=Frankia sp. CiP3 TaxID=2880971 RepID=UPI001EF5A5C7|nr:malonic semialdehyde reductase [Frankia sp. CiP3]